MLGVVEVISWVCFSDNWLAVSLEAELFTRHGGVRLGPEAGGCEAHFWTTVSVAGDCGALSGSVVPTVIDWLGLCCEPGTVAGILVTVC